MKLRILGNSIRIRVSQAELARIVNEGQVEESVEFAGGTRLTYRLRTAPAGPVSASFQGRCVSVDLPAAAVERWGHPEEVSVHGEQTLPGGGSLAILVEKDFVCLAPREGEDQSDLFPNPARGPRPAEPI